jgi:hypothetical protein
VIVYALLHLHGLGWVLYRAFMVARYRDLFAVALLVVSVAIFVARARRS